MNPHLLSAPISFSLFPLFPLLLPPSLPSSLPRTFQPFPHSLPPSLSVHSLCGWLLKELWVSVELDSEVECEWISATLELTFQVQTVVNPRITAGSPVLVLQAKVIHLHNAQDITQLFPDSAHNEKYKK